jgi:hypothetical protein
MRIFLLLTVLATTTPAFGVGSGDYNYAFLTIGKKSGAQDVSYDGEGNVVIEFQFNDRGGGPNTTTSLELNAGGIPVKIDITGNNY